MLDMAPETIQTAIIYGLIDGNTMELRYIGQTVGPLDARYRKHVTGRYGSLHFVNWIRSADVSAVVLERDPKDLSAAERRWIKKMRRQGARLLNISDGGNGGFVKPCSLETRAKMSATRKGHPFYGPRIQTVEHRAKISAALTGVPKTKSHRKAVVQALNDSPAVQKYRSRGASNA